MSVVNLNVTTKQEIHYGFWNSISLYKSSNRKKQKDLSKSDTNVVEKKGNSILQIKFVSKFSHRV